MSQTASNVSFSEYWGSFIRLLYQRRWTILTFLTVVLLMVVAATSLQTPLYRASATVLIDMETPSVLAVSSSARDDSSRADIGQVNYMTYADYYRTQIETMKSRALAKRTFDHLQLWRHKDYSEKSGVGKLMNQITVEPVKQTRLAKIYVTNKDPKLAARIANEAALVFAEENLSRAATTEALTLMKNEYLKLQSKEAELSKRYKEKFPARMRAREQMQQLAKAMEEGMKEQLIYGRPAAENDPGKSVIERLRQSAMIGGLRPNNIRVQDLAQVPRKPFKPDFKLNILLGFCLGLVGGLAAGFIEESLDNKVKSLHDLESLKLQLLGTIPSFETAVEKSDADSLRQNRYQFIYHAPGSHAAEAYRALRTNLVYTAGQSFSRSLIITSPGSQEGKSTTACNLSIALAQVGLRVLLVDADLRKPSVHAAFELPQRPGLSEYLTQKADFDAVVQQASVPGVWVVTSGVPPPNPAELLEYPRMKQFLKEAGEKFDRVLIDVPPVIPVTDAVVLAALVGSVLVVVQSGKTPRPALQRLVSLMNDVQAKILGAVLNNVAARGMGGYGYGYGYGYSVYSRYGAAPGEKKDAGSTRR